jgi:hypothetical protein
MLHYRAERNRRYNSLSYVKAITMEKVPPTYDELKHAYHLAGQSFVGKLKEIFVVLDDDLAKKTSKSGGGKQTTKANKPIRDGKKRRASGDVTSDVKKKLPSTQ